MCNTKAIVTLIACDHAGDLLGARIFQAVASTEIIIEHQAASYTIQRSQQMNFPQVQFESDKAKVLEAVSVQVLEMKDGRKRLYICDSLNFKLCMLDVKSLSLIPKSTNFIACKLAKYFMSGAHFREWDPNSITALLINIVGQERSNIIGTSFVG
ncbi:hypothetical protein MKX03_033633 [Papaver bracteatum]|nr:hypothetical protein MKX03_033633 [Papaver bracteatum]